MPNEETARLALFAEAKKAGIHWSGHGHTMQWWVNKAVKLKAELLRMSVSLPSQIETALCKCGHTRYCHDDEQPYRCFGSLEVHHDLCDCEGFEYAAKEDESNG